MEARIRGEYRFVGRGLLRGNVFHLRLERTGDRFAALCSTDGVHWLTCAQVGFPVKEPLRVGVWAALGRVVHFDCVRVLGPGDARAQCGRSVEAQAEYLVSGGRLTLTAGWEIE